MNAEYSISRDLRASDRLSVMLHSAYMLCRHRPDAPLLATSQGPRSPAQTDVCASGCVCSGGMQGESAACVPDLILGQGCTGLLQAAMEEAR